MRQQLMKESQVLSRHLNNLRMLVGIGLVLVAFASEAETFSLIESKPISELWINPGTYSYHFQRNRGLNNNNFGLGGEYRYSTVSSLTLGVFENSDRQTSHVAGWYWQPVGFGPARLGAVFGAMDGYPKMRNGGWFVAAIPTASIEYRNIGANIMFVPAYKGRLYGAISLQLKLKMY